MKRLLAVLVFLFISMVSEKGFSQSSPNTLDIVSWNLEWFGSTTNGPYDKNLQEQNVKKILRYLNADIYGLVEVVDTMRLRRVVDSLGKNYGFVVSDYCSLASNTFDADWKTGQKLAFVYNKNVVSNVSVRRMMPNSTNAYANFASGRFPFLMNANVSINGATKNINIILLHAKAGSAVADYNRRKGGAIELKDTLDKSFSSTTNFIIGDLNDDLDRTITYGAGPESSYDVIVKDSADDDYYKSITLPLSYAGDASTITYNDVIDHHIISDEAYTMYIANSAKIRNDIINVVPDYLSHTTSDHYPVFSQYNLGNVTPVINVNAGELKIKAFPNPVKNTLYVSVGKSLTGVTMNVTALDGKVLITKKYPYISSGQVVTIPSNQLPAGVYILSVQTNKIRTTIKMIKQ